AHYYNSNKTIHLKNSIVNCTLQDLLLVTFPPGCDCVIKVLGVKFDGTTAQTWKLTAQSKNTNAFATQRYATSDQDRLKHAIKSVIYGEGIRYRRYRADRKESHLY